MVGRGKPSGHEGDTVKSAFSWSEAGASRISQSVVPV